MKKSIFIGITMLFVVTQGFAARPTVESVVAKLTDECSGNGSGSRIDTYDVAKFNVAEIMAEMKANVSESCKDQRRFSTSKTDGENMTLEFLRDNYCVGDVLSRAEFRVLEKAINDPTNKAVLANIQTEGDNPEGCSYWSFSIYQANGKEIYLSFDETD